MKKALLFLGAIFTSTFIFGQNTFPDNGNVGIGTTTPVGKLDINTGSSPTYNMSGQGSGIISFGNAGNISQPSIISKTTTNNASGLILFAGTSDISNLADMRFDVRKNDSNDFTTLTTTAFRFSRYTTPLVDILRNGDVLIGTTANSLSTKLYVNGDGTLRPPTGGGAALNLVQTTTGSGAAPTNNKIAWMTTVLAECASIDVPDSRTNVHGVPMIFSTKDNSTLVSEKMRIANGGNVLIGTSVDPGIKLYVEKNTGVNTSIATFKNTNTSGATLINCSDSDGTAVASLGVNSSASTADASFGGIGESFVRSGINSSGLVLSTANSDGTIRFLTTGSGTERMRITNAGYVGIGTTIPDSQLTVNGTIHATEVKVTSTVPAPDYVFEKYYLGQSSLKPDYTLLTLSEVEEFTKENHHLPNVPSAKEIKENGLLLGEMSNILLQKIEELTLYSIEQQKTIEKQAVAIEKLEKENQAFKSIAERLSKIEKELEAKNKFY